MEGGNSENYEQVVLHTKAISKQKGTEKFGIWTVMTDIVDRYIKEMLSSHENSEQQNETFEY